MGADVTIFSVSFDEIRRAWANPKAFVVDPESVYAENVAQWQGGDRSWEAVGYALLGVCETLGVDVSKSDLSWSYDPTPMYDLLEFLEKQHGVDIPLDPGDPDLSRCPVEVPAVEGWPAIHCLSEETVQDLHRRLEASLAAPVPGLDQLGERMRGRTGDPKLASVLELVTHYLRWWKKDPEEWLGLEDASDVAVACQVELNGERLGEEFERYDKDPDSYTPNYYDCRPLRAADAMRKVLASAASRGHGLVIAQH